MNINQPTAKAHLMPNHRSLYSYFITPPISVSASQNCLVYHSTPHPVVGLLSPPSGPSLLRPSLISLTSCPRQPGRSTHSDPDLTSITHPGVEAPGNLSPTTMGSSLGAGGGAALGRLALLWALVAPGECPRLPRGAGRDAPGGCGLKLPSLIACRYPAGPQGAAAVRDGGARGQSCHHVLPGQQVCGLRPLVPPAGGPGPREASLSSLVQAGCAVGFGPKR